MLLGVLASLLVLVLFGGWCRCVAASERLVMMTGDEQPQER
jgi:hypothetical protein